ncbi:MAG TPA: hypothetical protein VN811_11265 [Thermoanaerobaculia bacterium]|nr:hypothetical protein [Thermoanaerobaculia bacterium]
MSLMFALLATSAEVGAFGAPIGSGPYAPDHSCPSECNDVVHTEGDIVRHCNWYTTGPAEAPLVEGEERHEKTCTVRGVALDVEPLHRLFVHGLHDNSECWKQWYDYVIAHMDCPQCKTIRDETGKSSDGNGTSDLLTQVAELAAQINSGFAGVADRSVYVYAHSLGALKMEALLQLGYERGAGDPWFEAGRKILKVYIFQGAHGGCSATGLNGDWPYHGFEGCPASEDIGSVNDAHLLLGGAFAEVIPEAFNPIPRGGSNWNVTKIVWNGEKEIHYVVADADGGECSGASRILCRDSEPSDGAVYRWQMVPTWFAGFADAKAAGYVVVHKAPGEYCHRDELAHPRPMVSEPLMREYVGLKKVRRWASAVTEQRIERTVSYCDEECFCRVNRVDACSYNHLDCSALFGPQWDCRRRPGGGRDGNREVPYSDLPHPPLDLYRPFTEGEVGDPTHPDADGVQASSSVSLGEAGAALAPKCVDRGGGTRVCSLFDESALQDPGGSTTWRVWVEGRGSPPIQVRLHNSSPGVVRVKGGDDQIVHMGCRYHREVRRKVSVVAAGAPQLEARFYSPSLRQEAAAIAASLVPRLARIEDDFVRRRAALGEEPAGEGATQLLDDSEAALVEALSYQELAPLRDYVVAQVDKPTRGAAGSKLDEAERLIRRLRQLADSDDLTTSLCVTSDPARATFRMRAQSFDHWLSDKLTTGDYLTVSRGYYIYSARKGLKAIQCLDPERTGCAALDLVDDADPVFDCDFSSRVCQRRGDRSLPEGCRAANE